MTNLEYYKVDNLYINQWRLSDNSDLVVFRVDYKPKHTKETIVLFSKVVEENDLNKHKVKWLLEEHEDLKLSRNDIINEDTMYVPRHAKVHRQFCFEG